MSTPAIDDLDRAILRELEADGRRAFREIGRTLGASEATIRARVKRMQDLDILSIVAFSDPRALGNTQLSLVFVEVEPARHETVVEAITALPQATYVSTILGHADLCVELLTADNDELWTLLNQTIGRLDGVRRMETTSIMQVHKLRYSTPI